MASNGIDIIQEKAIDQRPNYFAGQYLLEDDFLLEQKYHIDRQRRHNRLLHVSGIAEGLKVSPGGDMNVNVSAGTAIDSQGRQIILPDQQDVDLVKDANKNNTIQDGYYTFTIKYREELTEQQGQDGQEEQTNRRVQEKPEFELILSNTLDVIPLAKLTINGGKVTNIDESVRKYSGICLPTEDGKGVTLRSQGNENLNLASLTGSLSISGTLAVTENTQLKNTLTVKGKTTIDGELEVKKILVGDNKNSVEGSRLGENLPPLIAEINGSMNTRGNFEVIGTSVLTGHVEANGGLTVVPEKSELENENAIKNNALTVKGGTTVEGLLLVYQSAKLAVEGNVEIGKKGNTEKNAKLTVYGKVIARGIDVEGVTKTKSLKVEDSIEGSSMSLSECNIVGEKGRINIARGEIDGVSNIVTENINGKKVNLYLTKKEKYTIHYGGRLKHRNHEFSGVIESGPWVKNRYLVDFEKEGWAYIMYKTERIKWNGVMNIIEMKVEPKKAADGNTDLWLYVVASGGSENNDLITKIIEEGNIMVAAIVN